MPSWDVNIISKMREEKRAHRRRLLDFGGLWSCDGLRLDLLNGSGGGGSGSGYFRGRHYQVAIRELGPVT